MIFSQWLKNKDITFFYDRYNFICTFHPPSSGIVGKGLNMVAGIGQSGF